MSTAGELEGMSKKDSSWRPCQVSLSSDTSTSFGLIVNFGSQDSKEVILTKEEALKHLRIRSVPLHGDDCFHIKEGEHLLAGQETQSEILFFDAEVKKVLRVRHSKRTQCRCTFEIKWLYLNRIETVTVPASLILKLAKNTVDNHPTVAEFLSSVETYEFPDVSSFVSLFEESVLGFDIEKQIEEIGRFADASRSRSPEDCPRGFGKDGVDLMGQMRHRTVASHGSFIHDQGPPTQNNYRRTTRSQRKVQVEAEKIPPPLQPVITEPDRTHLSPLGARAALASLMYKLPSDSDFSASKLTSTISLDLTSNYLDSDISVQDNKSVKGGFLSNVGAYPDPFDMARSEIRTSERRDAANNCLQSTVQLDRLGKPVWTPNDTQDIGSKVVGVQRSSTRSQSGRKQGTPRSATRITRSTIQKVNSLSNDEVEVKSSPEDIKLCVPMRTPRVTRSTIQKDVTVDVSEGMQGRWLAQDTDSSPSRPANQKGLGPSNDELELEASSEGMNISSPTITPRLTRSAIQKEIRNGTIEVNNGLHERKFSQSIDSTLTRTKWKAMKHSHDNVEAKASSEVTELPNGTHKRRFTRSVQQKEAQEVKVEVNKGPEEIELFQQAPSYSSREDHVTPQTEETRRKRPFISSNEGINLSLPQESKKEQSISSDICFTQCEGEIPGPSARSRRSENNPASSKTMPVMRSSPRLGFLPRTRSQKKQSLTN